MLESRAEVEKSESEEVPGAWQARIRTAAFSKTRSVNPPMGKEQCTSVSQTLVRSTSNIRTRLAEPKWSVPGCQYERPVVEWRCAYADDPALCPLRFAFKHLFRLQIGDGVQCC